MILENFFIDFYKGRRPLHNREFPEISIQTHSFESLCGSLWREQQRDEFAVKLCRIARLRVAAQLYAAAGFTLAVANFRSGLRRWLARA